MSGSWVAVDMATATPPIIADYDGQVVESIGVGLSASATATFSTTGACTGTISRSGLTFTKSWYAPNTAGIGTSYWVKATLTTGKTPSSGTMGAWTQITTNQAWTNSVAAGGSRDSIVKFQIASDAGGVNIVYTGTIGIIADGTL